MDKQKIKIAGVIIIILLAVVNAVYRFSGLSDESAIEDKDALNALKWLQLADKKQFAKCVNTAENPDKWFKLFQDNRESLGDLSRRKLKSKTRVENGIYKIIFDSAFLKAKKINETIWISQDAKVYRVKYLYPRMPYPSWRTQDTGVYSENEAVKKAVEQTIDAVKNLDIEFFDRITIRGEKFRFGKKIVANIKQQNDKFGTPYKYQIPTNFRYTRSFPGQTELNAALAYVNCYYNIKNQPYRRGMVLVLYKDNSSSNPRWEIYRFSFGRLVQVKPPKPKEVKKS